MSLTVGRSHIRVLVESIERDTYAITIDPQGSKRSVPLLPIPSGSRMPRRGETWIITNELGGWTFASLLVPNLSAPDYTDQDSLLLYPVGDDTWVDEKDRNWTQWGEYGTYGTSPRGLLIDGGLDASLKRPIVVHPGTRYYIRMPLTATSREILQLTVSAQFLDKVGHVVSEGTYIVVVSDPFTDNIVAFKNIESPIDGYGLRLKISGDGDGEAQVGPILVQRVSVSQNGDSVVVEVVDEYTWTLSPDVAPTTGWSTTAPPWGGGRYIWRRMKSSHSDGTHSYSDPVVLTGNEGVGGEDAVLVRIASSRGTTFKNSAISTVLTVTIFKGAQQIVNAQGMRQHISAGAYLEWWWRRPDDTEFGVILVTDHRLSDEGFTFTVSPADVDEQTVFQCILHT